jgi:transketolase
VRARFYELVARAVAENPRVAVVLADIGAAYLPRHGRIFNVGIREQLMIGVAAGLAMEGYRPVVHSYAPFLVERPYEQVKLDLGHQDVGAVLVSTGASYDAALEGRTHQCPADVGLMSALPGWTIHVPGHADELERSFASALERDDRVYIRMSEERNAEPIQGDGLVVLRDGRGPLVVAVGPTLDPVLAATAGLDAKIAYLSTVRPFDVAGLRAAVTGTDVVLVEPYLAGTSSAAVADALADRPFRLLALGVRHQELRRYGSGAEHRAAHGLDAPGIRGAIAGWAPRLAASNGQRVWGNPRSTFEVAGSGQREVTTFPRV